MSATIENFREGWKHAFRVVSPEHFFSLADQTVVSGTSFLTTVLIARWGGSSQLGIYAVGMSLLLSLLAFQDSLILQPYSIQRHSGEGTPSERAGASLAFNALFSAASIVVLVVAATFFLKWGASPEMVLMTWAIAAIVPFALTRDFARRFAFAHLDMGRALLLDVAVAVIQLSTLGWLGVIGRMSALGACAALGGACAIPTAVWLFCARAEFKIRVRHVRAAIKQTWALGKWLLAGRITVQMQGYLTYWISMAIAGAAVTGAYAACMSLVGFANPLLVGLNNIITPRSVLAWKTGGGVGLWREAIRNAALIGALMAPFSLTMLIAGEYLMRFLYQGTEFEGLGHTLTVVTLGISLGALGTPASCALAAMERPRAIVVAGAVGAAVTVILVWLLMTRWGLLGAAYGLLGGSVAGTVGRWAGFYSLVPGARNPASAKSVLMDFTRVSDDKHWAMARIGDGSQAEIFVVNSTRRDPIWRGYHTLVAKVYKPEAALTFEMVQAQFEALSGLHAALDGRKINGWNISVPLPLYVCKSPLALVMTAVPGKQIEACMAKDESLTLQVLPDAARASAMAMQACWSCGRRHGDLGIQNLLFDVDTKVISFIDAGTADSCRTCNGATENGGAERMAAAPDLAHLLCIVATDLMNLVDSQPGRLVKEIFAETFLLTAIENADSEEDRSRLLNEIWDCMQGHLTEWLEQSWSLKGVMHKFGKEVAKNRIRSILERVSSHSENWTAEESAQSELRARRAVQSIMR